MRSYETALIYRTSLSEGDLDKGLQKLAGIISENAGTLLSTRKWGRRQFAYPIQKQEEGIYIFLRWQGGEGVSAALDKYLKLDETCLRFLTLRVDGKSPVEYELQEKDEVPLTRETPPDAEQKVTSPEPGEPGPGAGEAASAGGADATEEEPPEEASGDDQAPEAPQGGGDDGKPTEAGGEPAGESRVPESEQGVEGKAVDQGEGDGA